MVSAVTYILVDHMPLNGQRLGPVHGQWSCDESDDILVACATHFYRHHQGWELKWPATIEVYDASSGEVVCRGPVQLDYQIYFHTGPKRGIDSDRLQVVI